MPPATSELDLRGYPALALFLRRCGERIGHHEHGRLHALGEGVNCLRKMTELVINGPPVFEGAFSQAENEPIQKIPGFPSQIIIIEYPRLKQGAFVDVFRGCRVEFDEDVEHAAIDISDVPIGVGELHI